MLTVVATLLEEEEGVNTLNTPNAHVTVNGVSYPVVLDIWQLLPLASDVGQLPIDPGASTQGSGMHVTGCPGVVATDPTGGRRVAVSHPSWHFRTAETAYPALHEGRHDAPLAKVSVQLPIPPLATEKLLEMAHHPLATHVAALLKLPRVQIVGPDDEYPALHEILQEAPLAKVPVHVPNAPFVGAVAALHGLGLHVAAVSTPTVQLDDPDTV